MKRPNLHTIILLERLISVFAEVELSAIVAILHDGIFLRQGLYDSAWCGVAVQGTNSFGMGKDKGKHGKSCEYCIPMYRPSMSQRVIQYHPSNYSDTPYCKEYSGMVYAPVVTAYPVGHRNGTSI